MFVVSAVMFVSMFMLFERNYEIKTEGVENFVAPTPEKIDSLVNKSNDYVFDCETDINYDAYQLQEKYFSKAEKLKVRTVVHYFSNDEKTNFKDSNFIKRVDLANQFFDNSDAGIEFIVEEVTIHYGSPSGNPQLLQAIEGFEEFLGKERNDLRDTYYGVHFDFHHSQLGREDAMNIYIYNDPTEFTGRAGSIESNYFALNLKYMHPELYSLEHELGHCLGLYHTHQFDNSDMPHSQTHGDFVCETHKTFPLSTVVDNNCKLMRNWEDRLVLPKVSNPIDSWDTITPSEIEKLIINVMSYTVHSCRQEFLPEQIRRMRKIFEMNSDMRKMVIGLKQNFKQNIIKSLAEVK